MISATRYASVSEINRQTDLSKQITRLQESISSQKRLNAASDDPAAANRVTEIRQTQADQVVWTNNIGTGSSIASAADNTLASINTLLDRAKNLVLAGRNDTSSADDRTVTANELRGLADNLDSYSKQADPTGRPLFPEDEPLTIPVSDTSKLPATQSRDTVFGSVTTAAGTQSLQDILRGAADALQGTDPTQRATGIDASLTAIDAGSAHIQAVQADQGVIAQRFDDAKSQLTERATDLTEERSSLEDTDLTYALSEFQSKQVYLQAAQAVYAQSNKSSLFDLIG